MSGYSEYIGIRLAMADALQQYYKKPGVDSLSPKAKQNLLKKEIKAACERNHLLGERKEIIGEAWERLIASRQPQAIEEFVDNEHIRAMTESKIFTKTRKNGTISEIKDNVRTIDAKYATAFIAVHFLTLNPMNSRFEKVAQKTGMIDYQGLHGPKQSLSGLIDGYAELARLKAAAAGKAAPPRKPEDPDLSHTIKKTFKTKFSGEVPPEYLQDNKKSGPNKAPSAAPDKPNPGAIQYGTPPPRQKEKTR